MPPVSALIIRSTLTIFLFFFLKKNAPTSGDAEIYIRMGMKKILVLILASGLGLPGPLSATPSSLSEGDWWRKVYGVCFLSPSLSD